MSRQRPDRPGNERRRLPTNHAGDAVSRAYRQAMQQKLDAKAILSSEIIQKLGAKAIRSAEIIQKPDGRYLRVGYVKKENPLEKAGNRIKETVGRATRGASATAKVCRVAIAVTRWAWRHKKATAWIAAGILAGYLLLSVSYITLTDGWFGFGVDPSRPRPPPIPAFSG